MGSRLEQISELRIPPLFVGGTLLKTSANTKCTNTGSRSSGVENTTLVSSPPRIEHSTTPAATTYPRPINKATGSSPTDQSPTSRVASIRQSYTAAGVSKSAQNLLLAAWRKGTSDSYSSAWRKWASWCCEREINPVCADIASILDFLTFEFDSGKAYRTLNVYRSAISMTHPPIDSLRVGEHPLVSQLLKGMFNSRPPLPRYSVTWDIQTVIDHIKSLGNNEALSLKCLSQKFGILLAITSLERVSEVVAHDLRFRRFLPEGVVFELPELVKKSRFQHGFKKSFHAGFPENPNLCVVNCLREYEKRTKGFRTQVGSSKSNRLLLSYIRPHKPITSDTLSRWVVEFLKNAGVDTSVFKAHSTRSATSSAAIRNNCSLKDILALADWTTDSTFKRFYYRPVYNQPVVHNILSASSNSS